MTVVDLVPDEAGAAAPSPRPVPSWLPRVGLGAVLVLALVLNCWALSRNGYGNTYYSAAARSMSESWHNFFFAALDPGGFISIDKPPVSVWFQAASVWAFGVSSWSLLLPSALAGTAAVALLWCTVRRQFGALAAFVAALILAISPVSVAVNRLNLPEPYMILLLVAAAWAVVRSFDARRAWPWLVGAGVLIGLAFNVKMLAALIPTPALGLAVVIGARGSWGRRIGLGALVAAVALGVSASWTIVVDHVPAADRPYVGGSTNDTVGDLIFGYNGLNRIEGQAGGGPGGGPAGGRFPGGIANPGNPGATLAVSPAPGASSAASQGRPASCRTRSAARSPGSSRRRSSAARRRCGPSGANASGWPAWCSGPGGSRSTA